MKIITESRVALATGVELSIAECGDPAGAPIVLLHGYIDSRRSYEPLMAQLPPHLRLIAVTQRGHGDSSKPEASYGMDAFVADLAALFDHLRLKQAVVVGHSMGSLVAQRFALDHGDRVRALVLIGAFPTVKGNPGAQAFWDEALSGLQDPVPRELALEFQTGTFARPVARDFLDTIVDESLKVPARIWRGVMQALMSDDFSHELRKITAPTLILWGEKDVFCDEAGQYVLTRSIRGSRLIALPEIGHSPHWEEPRRAANILAAFIETLATPATPVGAS